MSDTVDTEITGSPASVESAANWLRDSLASELGDAADALNDGRRAVQENWQSPAGWAFEQCMSKGRDVAEDLEGATRSMSDDLADFAHSLRVCQNDMATIRSDAAASGLTVTGFLIEHPGTPPAEPAGTADQSVWDAYDERLEVWNTRAVAFIHARNEAERIDRKYNTACEDLAGAYSLTDHAQWIVPAGEVLGDGAAVWLALDLAEQVRVRGATQSGLLARADDLVTDAQRAITDMHAHPERYTTRKWIFWRRLDQAKLDADVLAINGKLDEAHDLLKAARALDDLPFTAARFPRFLTKAGKVLGPLGLGLGLYADWTEGESTTQIAVSQGASAAVGAAAGFGASVGTAALIGAAAGSVVPGVGTAVGAVVGTVVGAGVAIFADGAIDSFFENGPDVGKALEEGWEALEDTGEAIAGGISGAVSAIGGWFD